MKTNELLIFFYPGSRGDFLAALLKNKLYHCYKQHTIVLNFRYHKMHGFGDVNPWEKNLTEYSITQHKSIRIKTQPNDWEIIAKSNREKNAPPGTWSAPAEDVKFWEDHYQYLDLKFDYLVNFSDLSNVLFLQEFYQEFNKTPMPDRMIPWIEHNIALQKSL